MAEKNQVRILTFFKATPRGKFTRTQIKNLAFPAKEKPTTDQLEQDLNHLVSAGFLIETDDVERALPLYRLEKKHARAHPWQR